MSFCSDYIMENKGYLEQIEKMFLDVPDVEKLIGESPNIIPDLDRPEEYRYRNWNSRDLYLKD